MAKKKLNEGQENYNESKVFIPNGFVGMGNSTKGFNYNSSWGGRWENGGILPYTPRTKNIPSNGKYAKKTKASARDGKMLYFQQGLDFNPKTISANGSELYNYSKLLQPTSNKLPQSYKIPSRYPSSEIAQSIGGENGEPAYLIPSFKYGKPLANPLDEYKKSGEYLGGPFKTWQEADKWENEIRHPYVEKGQNIPSPLKWWGEGFKDGGELEKLESLAKDTGWLSKYEYGGELKKLDQLVNFSNYNKIKT